MKTPAFMLGHVLLFSVSLSPAFAQQEGKLYSVTSNVFRPEEQPFTEDRLRQLKVPEAFEVSVFGQNLGNVRMMAVANNGTVYITRPMEKDVIALSAANAEPKVIVSDLDGAHGIAIHANQLYLATVHEIRAADLKDDGSIGEMKTLVDDLPDGGQHGRRTLSFAPDGALHINIGSSCDACFESTEEKAANLRLDIQSGARTVFAHGLRNMLGFAWHPETSEMWGVDHGVDHLGDEEPGEELNKIEQGAHYGWPFCYADRKPDWLSFTEPPGDMPKDEFCQAKTVGPVLTFDAHASVINIVFYNAGQYPSEYRNDAFITLRGSANRSDPKGYKVVRVNFEDGQPKEAEDFLTGFLANDGKSQFGRPAGLAIAKDGSLLVSEDTNGVIYRISLK